MNITELYATTAGFGQWMLIAILLLFLVALFFIIKQIVRFVMVEKTELEQVQYNFNNLSADISTKAEQYNALLIEVVDSIVSNRITTFYHISNKYQHIDPKHIAETAQNAEKTSVAAGIIRFCTPLILLMGLMGFLNGLAITVSSLALLFGDNSGNIAQETFLPLSTGLYILFWSVLAAILLYILQLPLQWLHNNYFNKLEQFSNAHLHPLFNPPKEETQLTLLIEEVREHTQLANAAAGKMERVANQTALNFENLSQFAANFKTGVEVYLKGQQILHADITTLSKMLAGYKEQKEASRQDNLRIVEALNMHNVTLDNINKKIYDTDFNMADWLKEIISLNHQQQAEFKETLKSTLDLTRSNLSNIQSASNRFRINIDKFEKTIGHLEQHLTLFNNSIENASNNEVSKLNDLMTKMQEMTTLTGQMRTEVPDKLRQILGALQSTSRAADVNYVEQMAATIAQDKIQQAMRTFENENARLKAQVETLQEKTSFGTKLKGWLRLDK